MKPETKREGNAFSTEIVNDDLDSMLHIDYSKLVSVIRGVKKNIFQNSSKLDNLEDNFKDFEKDKENIQQKLAECSVALEKAAV